jgi:hypothetical protein
MYRLTRDRRGDSAAAEWVDEHLDRLRDTMHTY